MRYHYKILIVNFLCLVFGLGAAQAQIVIKGKVLDGDTGEELIGATLGIVSGGGGGVTDYEGNFALRVAALPTKIRVTYTGYLEQMVDVTDANQRLVIRLATNAVLIEGAVVKGQRIDDKQKAAPLTVENLDAIAIKETPAVNFYNSLGNLKGVDLTTASLGFTIINTRGFNSTSPVRSLQIIDGVDNQAPGLNFSLGNFLGAADLDVQKVDLIVGASSAFYGPNAFNGVISMETKNPFLNRGVAASIKAGERNLWEGALRLAGSLKNKAGHDWVAGKVNFFYLQADDWVANNYEPVSGTKKGLFYEANQNPGRWDAVNIYGDEFNALNDKSGAAWWFKDMGLGTYHRTGYREEDLVEYDTRNLKTNAAVHFRLNPAKSFESPELILASSFGTGTTVYQGDNRFSLRDLLFFQNRIELRKRDRFFIRAYATNEDAGRSFDPYFTALKMQQYSKTNEQWASAYNNWWINKPSAGNNFQAGDIYLSRMLPLGYPEIGDSAGVYQWMDRYRDSLVLWHSQAEAYANKKQPGQAETVHDFLVPGTPEFQAVFDSITSRKSNAVEGGTRFYDKSALYHVNGEYVFTPKFLEKWIVGASGRMYRPVSDGTIFKDTAGTRITNREFGLYTGAEKKVGEFTFNAAVRIDKNENFNLVSTPAASIVWNPKQNTYWRVSFSSAVRNPTLTDQYLNLNVGRAILLGNLDGFDSLITIESFNEYRKALSLQKLKYFNVRPIQPEKAKTLELGYRSTWFNKLYVDAGYYFNFYDDFIGYNIGLVSQFDPFFPLPVAGTTKVYRVAANSTNRVTTQGAALGLNYYFRDYYMISGNYSWNKLNKAFPDDPIIPAFNTPEHKFNVGLSGRDIPLKKGRRNGPTLGFSATYKWIQGFDFEGSPQFTGDIPDYDLVDAQVNLTVPKIHTTFKLGAANVFNNARFQAYGGPRIGRLAYFHIVYDFRKTPAN